MKIMYVPCGEDTNITTELVVEIGPELFSGLTSTTSSVVFIAARISYNRQFSISFLFFLFSS